MKYTLIGYIDTAFVIYNWIIIARILLSWVNHDLRNPLINFIYSVTEPVLQPFRRVFGGRMALDFSPLIAIIVLQMLKSLVIRLLLSF